MCQRRFAMLAFLDTEFTDLVIQPRLLSVGLVTGTGIGGEREFYAEVIDRDRIHAASWFALSAVLPQFGKVPHQATSVLRTAVNSPFGLPCGLMPRALTPHWVLGLPRSSVT